MLLCLVLAASAGAACSSSSNPTSTSSGSITLYPGKVFVGVDDARTPLASVPISLTGASGTVTWTSDTPMYATVTGNDKKGTIAAVAPGTAVVIVHAGDKVGSVSVTVHEYPAADVVKGKAEYVAAKCDECHGATGPDITTSSLAKHTDDQIIAATVDGTNPEGGDIAGKPHKFTATKAIVAYLRTLPARTDTPVEDK